MTVWSPLAGGLLTGKYRTGASPDGARLSRTGSGDWDTRHFGGPAEAAVDAIAALATAKGCTPGPVWTVWCWALQSAPDRRARVDQQVNALGWPGSNIHRDTIGDPRRRLA